MQRVGTENIREWGPTINRVSWDTFLTASSFTGIDGVFPVVDDRRSVSAIISTVAPLLPQNSQPPHAAILIDRDLPNQVEAASQLQILLAPLFAATDIVSTRDINQINSPDTVLISLLEVQGQFLNHISEENFVALQNMISRSKTIIWLASKEAKAGNPTNALVTGFARSIRGEHSTKFVTIQLGDVNDLSRSLEKAILVVEKTLKSSRHDMETEYAVVGGLLCINRIAGNDQLNKLVARKTLKNRAELGAFRGVEKRQLKLAIAEPGVMSSLQYVEEDGWISTPLAPDEIEVEVKAAGLNFRDVLIALGQLPVPYLGSECAGIVVRCGEVAIQHFQPGDRVCCLAPGCFKTSVRCSFYNSAKIPESISFLEGAALPVVHSTAYYAIVHVAHLKANETILIHSGAGGFGQACIQMAKIAGAKIFTTVSTEEKKTFLVETYGIAKENIFSSRTPVFSQAIKTLTDGRGVDVIINTLAGEALKCTWDCIGPFGRFIEAGKKDIYSFGTLPMFPFAKNVTFSAIDQLGVVLGNPHLAKEILAACVTLLSDGKLVTPGPLNVYPGSKIEDAFRYLESGKSMGKVVVELKDDDVVPVSHLNLVKPESTG